MPALGRLNADHLLRGTGQTCVWYARTGSTETRDANGVVNRADTFATGVTLSCMIAEPSRKWLDRWPDADLRGSIQIYLPAASTVAMRDMVLYDSLNYRVIDVGKWPDVGIPVLCQRTDGID